MANTQKGTITLRFGVENADAVRNALKNLGRDGERAAAQIQKAMDGKGKWNGLFQNIKNDSAAAQSSLGGLTMAFGRLGPVATLAARVVPLVAGALAVNKVYDYAEAWGRVEQRLVSAQISMGRVPSVQMQVAQTAFSARTQLEATATLYSRLLVTTKDFGATQGEVARATEVVAKALAVGGQTAGEVSSTILQLTQGFAAGRFQGDELRSILENSIPITQAIAREFGVTAGELKKLGEEGRLTADRVFKALISAGKEVEDTFSRMAPTATQALEQMGTATNALVGEMDRASGVSKGFASGISAVAEQAMKAAKALNEMNTQRSFENKMSELDEREALVRARSGDENAEVSARSRLRILGFNAPGLEMKVKASSWLGRSAVGSERLSPEQAAKEFETIRQLRSQLYRDVMPSPDLMDEKGFNKLNSSSPEARGASTRRFLGDKLTQARRSDREKRTEAIMQEMRQEAAKQGVDFDEKLAKETAEKLYAMEDKGSSRGGGAATAKDRFGSLDDRFNFRAQINVATATEKRARFTNELNEALKSGVITEEERAQALDRFNKELEEEQKWAQLRSSNTPQLQRLANEAKDLQGALDGLAAHGLDHFADSLTDIATGAKDAGEAFEGMTRDILSGIVKIMVQRNITGPLAEGLAGFDLKSLFPFADGGVMTRSGPLPLRRYASGGVASSPQLALFGEGRMPEAYVPLPNGRSIPVQLRGAGSGTAGGVEIHIHEAPGVKAETRQSQGQSGGQRLDIIMREQVQDAVVADLAQGGTIARALENSYNVKRQV